MSWKPLILQWPESLQTISDELSKQLDIARDILQEQQHRLSALNNQEDRYSKNEKRQLSLTSQNNNALDSLHHHAIHSLFDLQGQRLVIHPWQYGVGSGNKHQRTLSGQQALNVLADKLNDLADPALPHEDTALLSLLFNASGVSELDKKLREFTALFPVPELNVVQRRASQMALLETEQSIINKGPRFPRWNVRAHQQLDTLRNTHATLNQALASTESINHNDESVLDPLAALMIRKQSLLENQQTQLAALQDPFQGEHGQVNYFTGNAQHIAQQVKQVNTALESFPLCVLIAFIAPNDKLTLLREVFGA